MKPVVKAIRKRWTIDDLKEESKKYTSKSEFKKHNSSAYNTSLKLKILDDLYEDIRIQWNEDKVRKEASKYKSKSEFKANCSSAYVWARKNNIVNNLGFTPLIKEWDDNELIEEVKKYSSKSELFYKNPKAYYAARKKSILDIYFINKHRKLDMKFLIEQTKKYNSKYEFEKADGSAYQTLRKNGLIDKFFNNIKGNTKNNVVYIYRIDNLKISESKEVYKIGITSDHLDEERIEKTSKRNKWDILLIVLKKTRIRATIVESSLLKIGRKINISREFDGFSEVREMDLKQLEKCINIINRNSVEVKQ